MRRWMLLCGTLCLGAAGMTLVACNAEVRNPFARYPGYDDVYVATGRHGAGGAGGYAGSPASATTAHPLRPGEELWIVPTGAPGPGGLHDNASPDGQANTPSTPAASRLPDAPILAARQADGHLVPVPLKHTTVSADITGYIASVGVTQEFTNPYPKKIEAVYVFPLPETAGINEFVMTIGQRHIRGIIRERADAQKIYEAARAQGYVASMMTQERPNLFTQNISNIEPGKQIDIHINYLHTLAYDNGWFEWQFPMTTVVAANSTKPGVANGASPDAIPDMRADQRSGRDISLSVVLNAGMPLEGLTSVNHKIIQPLADLADPNARMIQLDAADAIPNKDFILRYKVAGNAIKTGMFIQKNKEGTGGWFTAMVIPPAAPQNLPDRPIANAALTNLRLEPDGMQVSDVYPTHIPDLPADQPVIIIGRFTGAPSANTAGVGLTAQRGEKAVAYTLRPQRPVRENPGINTLWARAKLADLYYQTLAQHRDVGAEIKSTALEYGLVSDFTSFVAVDSTLKTDGGAAMKVAEPVPEGARGDMTVQEGMGRREN